MRVLLLEDDDLEVRFLERRLTKAGIAVRACRSAEAAMTELTVADLDALDWIIVDVRLPGADGFAFLDWLEGRGSGRPPRVVIFTTSDFHKDLTAARRHRVDGYFVKGFGEESADRLIRHITSSAEPCNAGV